MHLECITFNATAPGAAGAAAAAVTGDSLTIKNARTDSDILIVGHHAYHNAAGFQQIVYPSGHDSTRNWRVRCAAVEPKNRVPLSFPLLPRAQESMACTIAGSAVGGQIEHGILNIWYEDLPGIMAQLLDPLGLRSRFVRLVTVETTIATGAGGGYTGSVAINAASDLLRANTDYALLGASFGAVCGAVRVRAPDFGNVGVAIPGDSLDGQASSYYFLQLSAEYQRPMIPFFNSANKSNVLIDCVQTQAAVAVPLSLTLAQLA